MTWGLDDYLTDMMLHKLAVRTRFQGKDLSKEVADDNLSRAETAYSELRAAHNYTHVLVNHDGEGHPNWNRLPDGAFERRPEGDAGRVLGAYADILTKGHSDYAEHWKEDTVQ